MYPLQTIAFMGAGAIVLVLLFMLSPGKVVVFYFLVKPVFDRGTTLNTAIGRYVIAIALPTASFIYVLSRRKNIFVLPFKLLILIYSLMIFFSFFRYASFSLNSLSYYLRLWLPYLLYFSIPLILENREKILRFMQVSSLSGIFTLLMIFLQKFGLLNIAVNENDLFSIDGQELDRLAGGYFDAFSAALPLITSLFCTLFMIQYFRESKKSTFVYFILMSCYLTGLILTFHRMSLVVVFLTMVAWMVLNKRYKIMGMIALVVLLNIPTILYFVPKLYSDIWLLKRQSTSETYAQEEGLALDPMAFHGRGWLWLRYLTEYNDSSFMEKAIGIKPVGRSTHNDYLRVLISNGFIGLVIHLSFLAIVGIYLVYIFLQAKALKDVFICQLAITTLFFWVLFVIGGITLNVGVLSTLTWYLWMLTGMVAYQWKRKTLVQKEGFHFQVTGTKPDSEHKRYSGAQAIRQSPVKGEDRDPFLS